MQKGRNSRKARANGQKIVAAVVLVCIILIFTGVILLTFYYARDKEEDDTEKSIVENTETSESGLGEAEESENCVADEQTDSRVEVTTIGQNQTDGNDDSAQQTSEANDTSHEVDNDDEDESGAGNSSEESGEDTEKISSGENGEDSDENFSNSEGETATENDTSNGKSESTTLDQQVWEIIDHMTLEEKVAQLFVVTPEQLTGVGTATVAGETTRKAIERCPVGGIIYFKKNIQSEEQIRLMLANTQQYFEDCCGFKAFLVIDEENGEISRLKDLGVPIFDYLSVIGARGDTKEAYNLGQQIGEYLSDFGFNMDTAPVADVLTNPENTVVKYRSFGSDCNLVSRMAKAEWQGLVSENIIGIYKHFPGHGGTSGDTHEGYAYVTDTLEELKANALVPFQDAIDGGVQVIMVGHISCPNVTGDETPASLSKMMITDILREDMGFDGIVITDALDMDAVAAQYTSAEAAVKALQAGADLLLMPADFDAAYQGVIDAVNAGTIAEERIEESLIRILRVKLQM